MLDSFNQLDDTGFAFTFEHAIDRAGAVFNECARNERGAMASDANKDARQSCLCCFGKIDNFRDIGEIIAGKCDKIRLPLANQLAIVRKRFDLKVDDAHGIAGTARRLRNKLKPQRLKPQKDLGEHQWAGMNAEDLHEAISCRSAVKLQLMFGSRLIKSQTLCAQV
jgi:hypothetical protein